MIYPLDKVKEPGLELNSTKFRNRTYNQSSWVCTKSSVGARGRPFRSSAIPAPTDNPVKLTSEWSSSTRGTKAPDFIKAHYHLETHNLSGTNLCKLIVLCISGNASRSSSGHKTDLRLDELNRAYFKTHWCPDGLQVSSITTAKISLSTVSSADEFLETSCSVRNIIHITSVKGLSST